MGILWSYHQRQSIIDFNSLKDDSILQNWHSQDNKTEIKH